MNTIAKTNLYAPLIIILGGVYGTLFLELGIEKQEAATIAFLSLVIGLVIVCIGLYVYYRENGLSADVESEKA